MKYGKKIEPTKEMEALLALCKDWYDYADNLCGGELHCLLDDDNTDDYWLDKDVKDALSRKYDNWHLAVEIIEGLKLLNMDQRNWVTYNIHNTAPQDVFEEIEE